MKRQGGTIEQWWVDSHTYSTPVVRGFVFSDTYWPDNTPLRTSSVVSISEDKTTLETRNTIYKLGRHSDHVEQSKIV